MEKTTSNDSNTHQDPFSNDSVAWADHVPPKTDKNYTTKVTNIFGTWTAHLYNQLVDNLGVRQWAIRKIVNIMGWI